MSLWFPLRFPGIGVFLTRIVVIFFMLTNKQNRTENVLRFDWTLAVFGHMEGFSIGNNWATIVFG